MPAITDLRPRNYFAASSYFQVILTEGEKYLLTKSSYFDTGQAGGTGS